MKSEMEKMVPSYDSYMRKVTFGREHVLRETTVDLAGIKPGEQRPRSGLRHRHTYACS